MEEIREKTNTKAPTLVKAKGNAASDIAWRRISARARNRAEIFEGTKRYTVSSQGEFTGMTGRYVYQSYDGKFSISLQ